MDRICVYCGSSPGERPVYREAARAFAGALAARGVDLVYGGASVGTMGVLADAALDAGADVYGVIPEALVERELAHPALTELDVVDSMHARKERMVELADGFVALPGGFGTLEELLEVLTWAQLGIHRDPCGVLNVAGYYDGLVGMFDHAVEEGFVSPDHREMVVVADEPGALLDGFAAYEPPDVKAVLTDADEA